MVVSTADGGTAGEPVTGTAGEGSDTAVVDLLGVLAYAELSAFDHLAEDARMAPTLAGRAAVSAMAAAEYEHHSALAGRLTELGADPETAMAPFVAVLETYHSLTEPATWLESVVKAYVGDGLAADFYREIASFVDEPTGELIRSVLSGAGRAEFAVREVTEALAARPEDAGRLALYARRLVGEAISQAQHVLADRDSLMALLLTGSGELSGVAGLFTRITDQHMQRMKALGLGN